jgi:hypothetical protein
MLHDEKLFGDTIFAYTRTQAIEDGELIDISGMALAYRRNKAPISTSIPASLLIFHPIITYPLKNIVFYSTAHAHFHSLITRFLTARRASFCRSIQHQIVSHYL